MDKFICRPRSRWRRHDGLIGEGDIREYRLTIARDHPEYTARKLLLAEPSRCRLLITQDESRIEVEISKRGLLSAYVIKRNFSRHHMNASLRGIGEKYLDLRDPSVRQMLRYLVLPEMEVERIFNNLRYKYLNSIYVSGFENPSERLSSLYNNAFQALAGIQVYQGGTKRRRNNDYFWRAAGFKITARAMNDFSIERRELQFILEYMRSLRLKSYKRLYAELIAIKPGFHELWIHQNFFDKVSWPDDSDPRSRVLRILRGGGTLHNMRMPRFPHEINSKSYFSYAACNITEGPFVFRLKVRYSYFDEIKRIKSKKEKELLRNKFWIVDYFYNKISTRKQLKTLLLETAKSRAFL